jgi:hypothetical protein
VWQGFLLPSLPFRTQKNGRFSQAHFFVAFSPGWKNFLLLNRKKPAQCDGMKGFHPSKRPESFREKLEAAAHWGFLGCLLGGLVYPLIWQFILPRGQLTGLEHGLMLLMLNPSGWGFLVLTAGGLLLVPLVAAKSDADAYGRDASRMTVRWMVMLLITSALTIWAARHFYWCEEWIPVLLLLVPLPPAASLLLGPVRGRGAADGF